MTNEEMKFWAPARLKKTQGKFGFDPGQVATVAQDLLVRNQRNAASAAA